MAVASDVRLLRPLQDVDVDTNVIVVIQISYLVGMSR